MHQCLQARLISQALRKMLGNASKAGCTLIFLNQIRYKIYGFNGNPEVTSGGIDLKFFVSVRLEIRPIVREGGEDIGLKIRVRVQKSEVYRQYKQAKFEIIFGEGASKMGCIVDCAEMMDIVFKKSSWYIYRDLSQGEIGEMGLVENGDFGLGKLLTKVMEYAGVGNVSMEWRNGVATEMQLNVMSHSMTANSLLYLRIKLIQILPH
ncbi:DNA repair protein recA homolog 1, chloroplastic-like [Rutidosis leptorrhynchoides]|uniref:DNA repair protein recA homolog 1, chloroplastic-like n=1 Tax=Rutidosis leptorrhynchoides TaxID=125765 RepID=UPI003A99D74A